MVNLKLDNDLSIGVVRTNRKKTASIKVENGCVQVIVPRTLSHARVEQMVKKRTAWIRQKLRLQSKWVIPNPKEYVDGECFSYLGRNYRLKLAPGGKPEVTLGEGYLELGIADATGDNDKSIRKALLAWYKANALERLTEKTNRYAAVIGVSPRSISVREYKARWGSCSPKGAISYNFRIIIAPHHIVDYVVVHELCHLKHLNHSPAYWRCVRQVIDDYKERKRWLQEHGAGLVV